MISINTNLSDLILQQSLLKSTFGLNEAINCLTTGYKVNHAKDNAAGYSIIENLNTRISSMLQIQQNTEDGIMLLQTAEGGLEEIQGLLKRLRELTVQASNNTYDSKTRATMQVEADAILEEINRIKNSIEYDGKNLYESPFEATVSAPSQTINSEPTNMAPIAMSTFSLARTASAYSVMPASEGTIIEGAIDLAARETKAVQIDGVNYSISNKLGTNSSLTYRKDTSTGELEFIGNNLTIEGQADVAHNIIINGGYISFHGGNEADTVTIVSGAHNIVYGEGGNDTITTDSNTSYATIYGGDGDDTIENTTHLNVTIYGDAGNDVITSTKSVTAYGGDDKDTFYINTSGSFYGEAGDDDYYIYSTSAYAPLIDGGEGTNTVKENSCSTAILTNVVGANAFSELFQAGETKTITINNIDYEITNDNSTETSFVWQLNGDQINFKSAYFTIKGDVNKAHNVRIAGRNSHFYGGNLADTISVENSSIRVYSGAGDDNIALKTSYAHIFAGEGNDTLNVASNSGYYSRIYMEAGDDNVIVSGTGLKSIYDLGDGNDTLSAGYGFNKSLINGGNGTNTLSGTATNSLIAGIDDSVNNASTFTLGIDETKTISFNGRDYTIQNNLGRAQEVLYNYNPITGVVDIGGNYLRITASNGVEHNVRVYGANNTYKGGDSGNTVENWAYGSRTLGGAGDDNITNYSDDSNIQTYAGNDTITLNDASSVNAGEGDDTIIVNSRVPSNNIAGDAGNDTYYINVNQYNNTTYSDSAGDDVYHINANNAVINSGIGNDTFYVNGSNNTISSAAGDDYFVLDGSGNTIDGGTGNNYYVDNVGGNSLINLSTDPNSGTINFTYSGETITKNINGKDYTFTNNLSGSNSLSYAVNTNTQIISFTGSDLQIDCADEQVHLLTINGSNNIVNGGNLADTITVNSGSNNTINGNAGNDVLTNKSENNAFYGGEDDDTITLTKSTNLVVDAGNGEDTINVDSNNNTNISAGSGNDKVNISGTNNTVKAQDGNNTINITGNSNNVSALNGNNNVTLNSSDNTVILGNGENTYGISGNNNNVTVQNAVNAVNIYGNNNTVTQTKGTNTVTIKGSGNTYSSTLGAKNIEATGDGNSIVTGNDDDEIEVKGNSNTIETVGGANEIVIKGNSNQILGGAGVDTIKLTGSMNTALGGDSNDVFTISSGANNTIDGEGGDRNTIVNYSTSTTYSNVVDVTPKGFNLNVKVSTGSAENSYISTTISFNPALLSVDFSTQETARNSLESIDELINKVSEQILSIGSSINRLEMCLEEQSIKLENMISNCSTLRDADIAEESSKFIQYQILQQAGVSLLSLSRNLRQENILGLLYGIQ